MCQPMFQDDIDDNILQDATDDADLSRLMMMKNTLLVKGECWNNVTAKSILIIILLLD